MIARDFAELVSDARQSGSGYVARCPHHEDRHRSLSFADGQTALVVKCHAGCTIEEICAALGVNLRDLFPDASNGGRADRRIAAAYDYRDVDGRLLYQAVRFDPKGFAQRRPDGSGGWTWNLEGVPRVLYRLVELQGQAEIIVVEGEKDCDRLWTLGLPATTNAMGAGKWQGAYAEQLEQAGIRRAVLIADNDQPGVAHMQTVGRSLSARGVAVRLLHLPDLPPVRDKHGEDVSDWLDAGHTGEELRPLIATAPPFDPGDASPPTDETRATEPPRDGRPLEVIDLADLLTRDIAPPRSLVGPALIIAQGLSVGGGAPRLGKSLLCSNLAVARTFGLPWLGFAVEPGVTLYLQAEIPEAWLKLRFATMVAALADPDPPPVPRGRLLTVTRRGLFLDTAEGRETFRRLLDGLDPRPDLVIVDPLARFYQGEENSQRDVGRFVATLDHFIEQYGCAFLIPHHPSKPIKGDLREGGAKLRGMSGLWAAADGCWMLTRAPDGLLLTFEDLRHGEPPAPLYLERTPGLWLVPAPRPTDERLAAVARCVLAFGLSWRKLRDAVMADCEVPQRTAERLIGQATDAGLIFKDKAGLYRQPPAHRHDPTGGESTP